MMPFTTPYQYAFNNPVMMGDPSGMKPEKNEKTQDRLLVGDGPVKGKPYRMTPEQDRKWRLENDPESLMFPTIPFPRSGPELIDISGLHLEDILHGNNSIDLQGITDGIGQGLFEPLAESAPGFSKEGKRDYDWSMPPDARLTDKIPDHFIRPDQGVLSGQNRRFYTDFGYVDLLEFRYFNIPGLTGSKWDANGVYIALGFESTTARIYNYQWVQSIWRNFPCSLDLDQPYNDPGCEWGNIRDDLPFFPNAYPNWHGYTSVFFDYPSQVNMGADAYFMGELSLVVNYGDCIVPIITFNYGFIIQNGQFSFININAVNPSLDHLRLFETPKTHINLLCPGYEQ